MKPAIPLGVVNAPAPQRWAEVDLDALRHNVRALLARPPTRCRLIGVVKADGYGHGARRIAEAAPGASAWGLGVSPPEEAPVIGVQRRASRPALRGEFGPRGALPRLPGDQPGCRASGRQGPLASLRSWALTPFS
jgi:hypothetical protein